MLQNRARRFAPTANLDLTDDARQTTLCKNQVDKRSSWTRHHSQHHARSRTGTEGGYSTTGLLRNLQPVAPYSGFRFVCYCNDCQAFARFLERPDVLDSAGGTDIFQMAPGRVKLSAGTEAVRCLRLSDKGGLRWYTDCCRTPIGNTAASPRFPVIAVIHSFMLHGADGLSRDKVLGLTVCRIYERSAVGPLPPNAPAPPSLGVFARRASKIFAWWVLGLGRPSPLFDHRTNAPLAVPRLFTASERTAL
jgi:uncharacterized protein DUF6151